MTFLVHLYEKYDKKPIKNDKLIHNKNELHTKYLEKFNNFLNKKIIIYQFLCILLHKLLFLYNYYILYTIINCEIAFKKLVPGIFPEQSRVHMYKND